jgi:endonuclease/exonuclease/phosphatase family metal-dependent hydrolase
MFNGKGGVTKQRAEEMAEQYARFLREHGQPDIICTQETQGAFYPLLGKQLGYDQRFNLKKGTVILSRFPIVAGGDIPFGRTGNSTLWADIKLPSGEVVRVYNVHLQSNKVTTDATRIIDGQQDLDAIGKVMDKVGDATSTRTEQAQRLREHLLSAKHPVIVCGDFNDTPNSYVYRTVSRGLSDSFKESGQGLGHTFAGAIPFLRIDYILSDPGFKSIACEVIRERRWSDHYPVITKLSIP